MYKNNVAWPLKFVDIVIFYRNLAVISMLIYFENDFIVNALWFFENSTLQPGLISTTTSLQKNIKTAFKDSARIVGFFVFKPNSITLGGFQEKPWKFTRIWKNALWSKFRSLISKTTSINKLQLYKTKGDALA